MAYVSKCFPAIVWSNMVFLFTMSLLPFSTSYLAEQRMSAFSVMVYAITFMPMIISFMVMETILAVWGEQDTEYRSGFRAVLIRGIVALLVYATAVAVSFVSAKWAFVLILGNTLLYLTPEKLRAIGRPNREDFRNE
jgi:uncharacterized membrane protein